MSVCAPSKDLINLNPFIQMALCDCVAGDGSLVLLWERIQEQTDEKKELSLKSLFG